MEPVEDRQRHWDVGDNRPRPQAVEMQLHRVRLRPWLLQRVDRPHGQVRHQQERHDLPARLSAYLLGGGNRAPRRVQNKDGLTGGLDDAGQSGDQHEDRVLLQGEVTADDGKRRVDEHAGLSGHQEDIVELQISAAVVAQFAHLEHADQRRQGRHSVERQLADVHLSHGEADQLGPRNENEEEDEGDYGQH